MANIPGAKIYGVLGYPARHSLSPLMHNAAFKALGINAVYKIFEQEPRSVGIFLRRLSGNNISGLNVTVPYKAKVIPFLKTVSREARLIVAVNTIKVNKTGLAGSNTDAAGFFKHLTRDLKFSPRQKMIAIIGAGGAARAVSVVLARAKPRGLAVYDIDTHKARALVGMLRRHFPQVQTSAADSVQGLDIRYADLLVNASPVGMKKNDPCPVPRDSIHAGLLVYDLIYNPRQTRLLKIARQRGARVSNGLGMLLYQGARSFEVWTGRKAPLEIMRKKLMEGLT